MSAEVAQMDAVGRLGVAIKRIDRLRVAAEDFRVAMVESGALNKVSQDTYFSQLRALEGAIAEASQ